MVFSIKRKRQKSFQSPDGDKSTDSSRRKRFLLIIVLLLLIASNLFLFMKLMKSRKTVIKQQQVLMTLQEPPDASSEVANKWYGLCAKNSIHSIKDFWNICEKDPVLAQHFMDFDWTKARMGKREEAVWTHIAYRKDDRISTTRRVIRLPKGDGYITDGKRWVRTYCCNDYVVVDPAERADSPDRLFPKTADMGEGPDNLKTAEKELLVVPEPSSMLLLGSGIGVISLMRLRHRKVTAKS